MPSHFSTIGFAIYSSEQLTELTLQAASKGERVSTSTGDYLRFAPGAGAELWVQVMDGTHIVGCNPHFAGQGRVRFAVTQLLRDEAYALDGGIHGWVDPQSEDPESGQYPVFVAMPDFAVLRDRQPLPAVVTLQVAAFAHELTVYATEEEFKNDSERFRLAPEAFIPSGLFSIGGEPERPPRAEGIFAGHVMAAELRTNPVTGHPFHWLLVRTLGAVIDVVADPALVTRSPCVGGLVQGAGWLTGRVTDGQ